MPNAATLARRLLFSLLVLVGLLVMVELALRALRPSNLTAGFRFQRIVPAVAEDRSGRYEPHFTRFYTLAPRFRHSPTHLGHDATGDWPFRGRPPEPAPPGLLRVAVIGDSIVYGSSLDAADMPGSRIQDALAARGWTPDRVAVISLGVPGYSTVQLELLLEEALLRMTLDAVVLWPAAWNDQAPAMDRSDVELMKSIAERSPLDWLRDYSRLVDGLASPRDELSTEELVAAWKRGSPLRGYRVDAVFVQGFIGYMLARCAQSGVPAVVLASAHPPQTAADHPRTRQDAARVLDVARRASAPFVDAQALLDAAGAAPAHYFVDYVHPSPEANGIVGEALAQELLPILEARAAERSAALGGGDASSTSPLSIVDAHPRTAPVLGDATLRVTLSGWTRGAPLPAVIVGGAPLIDVRAAGEHEVEGTLMANAPGRHDLVVQAASGCAWMPDAIESLDPAITVETPPGQPASLRVVARPGDSLRVFVAAGRAEMPAWSPRGAFWLDSTARALPEDRIADAQGVAEWSFGQLPPGTYLVQALVAPGGEAPDEGLGSRWTAVVELSAPAAPSPDTR